MNYNMTVIVRMSGFAAHKWGNQVLTLATFLGGVHLDWLPCSTVVSLLSVKAMTASYLRVNISSQCLVQAPVIFDVTIRVQIK